VHYSTFKITVMLSKEVSKFTHSCGIRQGGVLSPYLFAIYIDNLVDRIRNCPLGCFIKNVCMSILLYADDILLVAPSVTSLQKLLHICEDELTYIDMSFEVMFVILDCRKCLLARLFLSVKCRIQMSYYVIRFMTNK